MRWKELFQKKKVKIPVIVLAILLSPVLSLLALPILGYITFSQLYDEFVGKEK